MNYLVDTNVISEGLRPKPNGNVAKFLETVPEERFYLSVLTLGEIRKGIESLVVEAHKDRLRAWLEGDLRSRFDGRVLGIDARVSDVWGRMLAARKRPAAAIDSLIAATALAHDLAVLTHDVKDFDFDGLRVVDPFSAKVRG